VALSRVDEKAGHRKMPGPMSSRAKAGFGETALQGQHTLQHRIPLAAAVVAVREARGVVVREPLGELGQRHRLIGGR
jgi:hypothetical protein